MEAIASEVFETPDGRVHRLKAVIDNGPAKARTLEIKLALANASAVAGVRGLAKTDALNPIHESRLKTKPKPAWLMEHLYKGVWVTSEYQPKSLKEAKNLFIDTVPDKYRVVFLDALGRYEHRPVKL